MDDASELEPEYAHTSLPSSEQHLNRTSHGSPAEPALPAGRDDGHETPLRYATMANSSGHHDPDQPGPSDYGTVLNTREQHESAASVTSPNISQARGTPDEIVSRLSHDTVPLLPSALERYQVQLMQLEQYDQGRRAAARKQRCISPPPGLTSVPSSIQHWNRDVSDQLRKVSMIGSGSLQRHRDFRHIDCYASKRSRDAVDANSSRQDHTYEDLKSPDFEASVASTDINFDRSNHASGSHLRTAGSARHGSSDPDGHGVSQNALSTRRDSMGSERYSRSGLDATANNDGTSLSERMYPGETSPDSERLPLGSFRLARESMLTPLSSLAGAGSVYQMPREAINHPRTERSIRMSRKRKAGDMLSSTWHDNNPSAQADPASRKQSGTMPVTTQQARIWLHDIEELLIHAGRSPEESHATKSALDRLAFDLDRMETIHELKNKSDSI